MKKRLLITSIVMMLVVAVALSTATYAWFTSNSAVTATSLTMTAATNNAASIGISWSDGAYGTTIQASSPAGMKFAPAAINSATADALFTSAVWSSATVREVAGTTTFNTAYSTTIAGGVFTATAAEAGENPSRLAYLYTDGASETPSSTIYIKNGSTTNDLTAVTCKATVTGEARDFIRIAIFRNDGEAGAFRLKGIMGDRYNYVPADTYSSTTTYYTATGDVADNVTSENVTDYFIRTDAANSTTAVGAVETDQAASTIVGTATGAAISCGALGHEGIMQLKVVVWMDGQALRDNTAGSTGKAAGVALSFDAAR